MFDTTISTVANISLYAVSTDSIQNINSSGSTPSSDASVFSKISSIFFTQYIFIILGFFAGYFRVLSKSQVRGLGRFVHRYAMSVVLFLITGSIQLEAIHWPVIWTIFLSRLLAHLTTICIGLVISCGRLVGLSAIVSLLLTNSDDIAVTYPILRILTPTLASHCCIVVALQLLLLNPISIFLLELNTIRERQMIQRNINHKSPSYSILRTLIKIFCYILLNPQLIAFATGLICNVAFKNRPPIYFIHTFNTFGETFISCALFYLGLVCANSNTGVSTQGKHLLPIILSFKVLIMPILARKLYDLLPRHIEGASPEQFILFYSLSPASSHLLQIASRYAVAPLLAAETISVGSLLLLPILFIYQSILDLLSMDVAVYAHFLEKTAVFVSWISVITGLWTRLVFLAGRKTVLMPHRFVICYLDCTLVTAGIVVLGALFNSWIFDPTARVTLADYIKFSFYLSAYYCTRMWTAFICIGMLIQRRDGATFPRRKRTVFYIFGLLTPIILTVSLKIVSHDIRHLDVNAFYRYGRVQQNFTLAVLIICFLGAVISLTLLPFYKPGDKKCSCLSTSTSVSNCFEGKFVKILLSRRNNPWKSKNGYTVLANRSKFTENADDLTSNHIDAEIVPLTNHVNGFEKEPEMRTDQSDIRMGRLEESIPDPNNTDGQIHRHYFIIGLNLLGMLFAMYGCFWRLLGQRLSTTVIVFEFFDQVFNFGQGFLVFIIYGIDVDCLVKPILKFYSKLRERMTIALLGIRRHRRKLNDPGTSGGELGSETNVPMRHTSNWRIAESFALRHLDVCVAEICKPIILPTRCVERAFLFADFRDWLLERHLCYNLEEILSLVLSLELNDYIRSLSIPCVYALDPEACEGLVFEFMPT